VHHSMSESESIIELELEAVVDVQLSCEQLRRLQKLLSDSLDGELLHRSCG
jgi:hypothetical protein